MVIKRSERKKAWMRIWVGLISGIVLCVWQVLIKLLAILNWIITVFSGHRNRELANFCEYWNTEMYKFYRYMTFVSNVKPVPFTTKIERISKFS